MRRRLGVPGEMGGARGQKKHTGRSGSANEWKMKDTMTHMDERSLQNEMWLRMNWLFVPCSMFNSSLKRKAQ